MTDTLILDRSFTRDPHEILRRLQTEAPVSRAVMWGDVPVWLVTRYDDAKSLLVDPRLSTDRARALKVLPPSNKWQYVSELTQHMLYSDPPDHTRLRKLVTKAFTARAVEKLTSSIEAVADELLDAMDTRAPVDMIDAYAAPLPARVIGELLGVSAVARTRFQELLNAFVNKPSGPEIEAASYDLTNLLNQLFAEKRREARNDLMSALLEASDDGDQLSETELMATTCLLIAAGYETTVHLIANGIMALLDNPSQLAALRADASLLPSAVEELLRIGSPINFVMLRFTTEQIRIGEVDIPENQIVVISLLAANHDNARFEDPDRLDISRKPNSHLAFGHGIHHCVGAPLARLEGRIALARLLSRFAHLEVATAEPLEYRNSLIVHGLSALPVRCQRHAPPGRA